MTSNSFDLVVIGAGPGGYVAAIRAAQLGLKVACVEKEPSLGGTCLRIGCIPSKALLESSEKYHESKSQLKKHGIDVTKVSLNLGTMLKRKEQIVSSLSQGINALFKKNKITPFHGLASIQEPGLVSVQSDSSPQTLQAKSILIATGSQPALLPGVEMNGDRIGSSTEALAYTKVPRHLVVIGAGYIGLELGSVWNRLGAKVTVLEYLDRILPGMDLETARDARKILARQGLEFQLGTKVTAARQSGNSVTVEREGAESVSCDQVLLAVGRKPNTAHLNLENLGIQLNTRGLVEVNERYATSVDGIFAIGDVIPGPMLAHRAEEDGVAFAEALVQGVGSAPPHAHAIPGIVYTQPEIASVGKTEEELAQANVPFRKGTFSFRANGRAHAMGQTQGKVKILAHQETDRILGVHIIGPHAGDLINEAAAAMTYGASSEDLARTCHAHPTLGETLKEAALAVDNRSLHS